MRCTGLREKERGEINKVWLALSLPPLGCEHKKDTDPSGGPVAGTSLSPRVRRRRRRGAAEPRSDWLAHGSLSAQGRWSNLVSIFCAPRLGYPEPGREREIHAVSFYFLRGGGEKRRRKLSNEVTTAAPLLPGSHPSHGSVPQLWSLRLQQNNSTCLLKARGQHSWPLGCEGCVKPLGNRETT